MKKSSLLLLCSGFAISVMAQSVQNQPNPTAEYKILFESKSYQLDEIATTTLEECIEKMNAENQTHIELQAATDDKGIQTENEVLAQNRADAVRQFLIEKGISTNRIQIKPAVLLTSDLAQNSEERRRMHRSVQVRVWTNESDNNFSAKGEKELLDFFVQEQQNAREHFTFEASTGMVVTGKKGTRLKVPADCFVYANGAAAMGPVMFTLQEALSYGDMLLQNLSTSSNGRMLETGGMFFIAATDVNGKELKIKEGAAIEASLPTRESSLPGMQVFEGVNDPHGNLDWAATGRALQPMDVDGRFARNNYDIAAIEQAIIDLKALTESSFVGEMPKFKEKDLKEPVIPNISKPEAPILNDFYAQYAQKSNESDVDYRKRVYGKYQSANKAYLNQKMAYNQKMSSYRRDSLNYVRDKNSMYGNRGQYDLYCKNLRNYIGDVVKIVRVGDYKEYRTMIRKTSEPLNFTESRIEIFANSCQDLSAEIDNKIKDGKPFEDLKEKSDALKQVEYTIRQQWGMKHIFKSISNDNIRYAGMDDTNRELFHVAPELKDMQVQLSEIEAILEKEVLLKKDIKRLERFHKDFSKMGGSLLDINSISTIHKNFIRYKNKLNSYLELEEKMANLKEDYLSKCAQLGLLTAQQVNEMYVSTMNITSMGWINCDRFMETKEPKTDMEILVENDGNTAVYVVFEDIRSVMKAERIGNSYKVKNIPAGRKVKVIGIHITGQSAEVFIENTVVKNTSLRPQFEPKTLEELRALMARV